ncbi:hypothetical protein RF11_07442 [Thelohanellus kitauei]|uniref:Uncharacterized protein n=1 Tax=Thelohanellus kitauei TaxID=669202 RepID=A0A0C2NDB8_THEKT|nr:hypothetical protein RF11_07442 [Thelohanellus kitauei]
MSFDLTYIDRDFIELSVKNVLLIWGPQSICYQFSYELWYVEDYGSRGREDECIQLDFYSKYEPNFVRYSLAREEFNASMCLMNMVSNFGANLHFDDLGLILQP